MVGAIWEYRRATRDINKSLAAVEKKTDVKRETAYYLEHIGKIKTADELLNDSKLYRYVMKAYDLEDLTYAKGLIRKVLTDADYAARLRDSKFQTLKAAFNFTAFKEVTTSLRPATVGTVARYKEMVLEEQVGSFNEGARQAIYFKRRIEELINDNKLKKNKDTWPVFLLGDKTMSKMVFSALGLSQAVQATSLDAKVRLLKRHMSAEDLFNPERRERFIKRALANYDVAHSANVYSPGSAALTILNGTGNISADLLSAINNLRPVRG